MTKKSFERYKGNRVRINSGSHAGREGVAMAFDTGEDGSNIVRVLFDDGKNQGFYAHRIDLVEPYKPKKIVPLPLPG